MEVFRGETPLPPATEVASCCTPSRSRFVRGREAAVRDLAGSTGLAPKLAEAGWEAIPAQSQGRRYTVNTPDFRATTTRRRYRLPTMTSNPRWRWWWDACEILLPNCHPTHTLTQSGKARTAKSKSRTRGRPPPLQQGMLHSSVNKCFVDEDGDR